MTQTEKSYEIPSVLGKNEIVFSRLGSEEQYDLRLTDSPRGMKVFELTWNEELEDWEDKEVPVKEVEEEFEKYIFQAIFEKPVTFRQLQTEFPFWMKVS